MADVRKATQLVITTQDKPGMLAEITEGLAKEGINIEAINAYGLNGKATFYLIAADAQKAKKVLAPKGWEIKEEEVVVIDLQNQPGTLYQIAVKLKTQGINLLYCYGTTVANQAVSLFVFRAENNNLALSALSK